MKGSYKVTIEVEDHRIEELGRASRNSKEQWKMGPNNGEDHFVYGQRQHEFTREKEGEIDDRIHRLSRKNRRSMGDVQSRKSVTVFMGKVVKLDRCMRDVAPSLASFVALFYSTTSESRVYWRRSIRRRSLMSVLYC